MASTFDQLESVAPTRDESAMARESCHRLARLLGAAGLRTGQDRPPTEIATIDIRLDNEHELVSIPASVLRMMNDILSQMAQGNTVSLVPTQCEVTTRQAAEILNVSRPFLIDLLEQGKIPFYKVGTHRRMHFGDVMAYKKAMQQRSMQALQELVEEGQMLEMESGTPAA